MRQVQVLILVGLMASSALASSCCPEEAWSQLEADSDYVEKGVIERVDDIDIYRVGNSSKCIVWNYDIFGFNSGRTRQFADIFADQGYMVVIPDYFRGTFKDPSTGGAVEFLKEQSQWNKLKDDWNNKICPYAKKHGAKTYGTIGTCWGSYMVVRMSSLPDVVAGISMHPSHSPIMELLGEDERQVLEDITDNAPQLFMPSGGDHKNVRPGGLGEEVLGDKLTIIEFPTMRHGWTVRGDISDPEVDQEVKRAMLEASKFFNEHLQQ